MKRHNNKAAPLNAIAVLLCIVALCVTDTAQASLLSVNVADPSAVVVAATGEFALIDDDTANGDAGVTLIGLFAGDFSVSQVIGGDLTPAAVSVPYRRASNGFASVTESDLNFVIPASIAPQIFTTGAPAFSGQTTLNLNGASLPAPGASGNIIVGDTEAGSGAVIGQWHAIPEPTSLALLGLGAATMLGASAGWCVRRGGARTEDWRWWELKANHETSLGQFTHIVQARWNYALKMIMFCEYQLHHGKTLLNRCRQEDRTCPAHMKVK